MYIKKTLLYTYIHALNISVPVAQIYRKQDCFFLPLKLLIKKAYKQQELHFHLLLNLQGTSYSRGNPPSFWQIIFAQCRQSMQASKNSEPRFKLYNLQLTQRDTRWCSDTANEAHTASLPHKKRLNTVFLPSFRNTTSGYCFGTQYGITALKN